MRYKKFANTTADHYKCSRYLKMFDDCKSANYVRKDILERLILTDMNSLLKDFEINTEKMLASLEEKFQFQADKEIRKNDENGVNLEKFISAV